MPVLDQPGAGRGEATLGGRGAWAAPDSLSPGDARPHLSFCPAALALPAAGHPRSGQGFLAEGRARRPFPWELARLHFPAARRTFDEIGELCLLASSFSLYVSVFV